MRILHIIPSLNKGGAEKFTIELCNELVKKNEVYLCAIATRNEEGTYKNLINDKVHLITLGFKKSKISLPIFYKLFKIIRKFKPDILHIHTTSWVFNLCYFFSHQKDIFITIHSTLNPIRKKYFKKEKFFKFLRKRVTYITISKSIYQLFSNQFPDINFFLIPNGITSTTIGEINSIAKSEMERLRGTKKFLFISLGSINYIKNQELLAFAALKFKDEANFVVFGLDQNSDLTYLKKIKLINQENLFILDKIDNVHDYLIHADALVLTSIFEGLPLVVLEAIQASLPVISTPVGGVPDVISNKINGFLTIDLNVESLENEIQNLLTLSYSERKLISKKNYNLFKQEYDMRICAKRHINLYSRKLQIHDQTNNC